MSKRLRVFLITNCIATTFLLIVAEVVLRIWFPFSPGPGGNTFSAMGARYGWGFDPGDMMLTYDPDTGHVLVNQANNHGWRDLDRPVDKPPGTYRILVLGDSNVYGLTVPADKVYTRVLESRLKAEGTNAEVINMAYPAWGTDQELEALQLEGLSYHPDLVIVHFTDNDLTDNTTLGLKPFLYHLDEAGRLVREDHTQDRVTATQDSGFKSFISHSQVLLRIYNVVGRLKAKRATRPALDDAHVQHVALALGWPASDPMLVALRQLEGQPPSDAQLQDLISRFHRESQGDAIRTILTDRWFTVGWKVSDWMPTPPDPTSREWRLYLALLQRIKDTCDQASVPLAVMSDRDQGHFQWDCSWYRISPGAESQHNYMAMTDLIAHYAAEHHIEFIPMQRPIRRHHLDPHPTAEGHQDVADNVHDFLVPDRRVRQGPRP